MKNLFFSFFFSFFFAFCFLLLLFFEIEKRFSLTSPSPLPPPLPSPSPSSSPPFPSFQSGALDLGNVRFFVLDEVDRLLDTGNNKIILTFFGYLKKSLLQVMSQTHVHTYKRHTNTQTCKYKSNKKPNKTKQNHKQIHKHNKKPNRFCYFQQLFIPKKLQNLQKTSVNFRFGLI